MRLYLEVIEGPQIGQKFSLEKRATLGRQGTDIEISDPRLSSHHVTFEFQEAHGWVLSDNQSRNGVWINGHKELRAILKDGDLLQLGGVQLLCRLVEAQSVQLSNEFQAWAQSLVKSVKNSDCHLIEIEPELRLRVQKGIQYDQVWEIFWGPRMAGRSSLDIPLVDDLAPAEAFVIRVHGRKPYFYTSSPGIVKINRQSQESKALDHGDVISFGDTEIVVEFGEQHGFSS